MQGQRRRKICSQPSSPTRAAGLAANDPGDNNQSVIDGFCKARPPPRRIGTSAPAARTRPTTASTPNRACTRTSIGSPPSGWTKMRQPASATGSARRASIAPSSIARASGRSRVEIKRDVAGTVGGQNPKRVRPLRCGVGRRASLNTYLRRDRTHSVFKSCGQSGIGISPRRLPSCPIRCLNDRWRSSCSRSGSLAS